jgi:hypothetical protein
MKLQDRATSELQKLESRTLLTSAEKLNLAGWYNGEWTCARCGLMIGKNLRNESPFGLARKHANECSSK